MSFAVEALATSPIVRAVDANGLSLLSKREMDVVRSLAEGLTNREIAERLGLSQHTIKNYLFRVYDKLGVSSRLELLFMTLTQTGAPFSEATLGTAAKRHGHRRPETFSAAPKFTGSPANSDGLDLRAESRESEEVVAAGGKSSELEKGNEGPRLPGTPRTTSSGNTDPLD